MLLPVPELNKPTFPVPEFLKLMFLLPGSVRWLI